MPPSQEREVVPLPCGHIVDAPTRKLSDVTCVHCDQEWTMQIVSGHLEVWKKGTR
jgi:hypothetical protein